MHPKAAKLARMVASRGSCAVARDGSRSSSPRGRAGSLFASYRRDQRASAAVEFSLIALVSLELLTEGMQAGLYFYTSAGVERATSKAVRQILTGAVSSAGYTAAQFRTKVICPALSATNLSCSSVITNIQTVNEAVSPGGFYTFLNASQTGLTRPTLDNSQTSYCTGNSQSYVYVQILYIMPVFSPIWRTFATSVNGSPSYILQSTAAFRNEPFAPGSLSC